MNVLPSHGEILAVLEELAPKECAEPGDESCFEIRHNDSCRRIGVCVDPTERNLFLAASDGSDFIITHHVWSREAEEVVRAKELSIYRLHSAWDAAPDGNLVTLARMLGLQDLVLKDFTLTGTADLSLRELLERCQRVVGKSVIPYCGGLSDRVHTAAILPGSGFLPVFRRRWEDLLDAGCDTIVSGEISHQAARVAQCRNVNLIDLGHNGLVKPGLAHLAYLLRSRLLAHGCDAVFYDDLYTVGYFTAWSSAKQEENRGPGEAATGVVLPFPR